MNPRRVSGPALIAKARPCGSPTPPCWLLLTLVAIAACAGSVESYRSEVVLTGDSGPVHVRWLANAGVWIQGRDNVVVIDGLYEGTESGESYRYSNLSETERTRAREGRGRWSEVDLVLVTHRHFDHFEASTVAAHLRANPGARLVGPDQAAERVRNEGGVEDERIIGLDPAGDAGSTISHGGLRVRVLDLPHGGSWRGSIENVGYVVEVDGTRILHVGDADTDPARFAAAAPLLGDLDLFLAPAWYFREGEGPRILRDLGAERLVGVHLPPARDRGLERILAARWPEALLFGEP